MPVEQSLRKFFGLTQTCRQIRVEYRPLWLRNSKFLIFLADAKEYCKTWFPTTVDLQHAPSNLQISCCLPRNYVLFKLTSLLKIRAHRPEMRCVIVSHMRAIGAQGHIHNDY
jgi:hypothetical protein